MVYKRITGKKVDKAYHTIMQDAVNGIERDFKSGELERVIELGLQPEALKKFLEAKNLCYSYIFIREYIEKARELIKPLKGKGVEFSTLNF